MNEKNINTRLNKIEKLSEKIVNFDLNSDKNDMKNEKIRSSL